MRLALVFLALLASTASASSGAFKPCSIQPTGTIRIAAARDMGCKAAARVVADYQGSISRRFDMPRGFACHRISGGRLAGVWKCVNGPKAFKFDFAD